LRIIHFFYFLIKTERYFSFLVSEFIFLWREKGGRFWSTRISMIRSRDPVLRCLPSRFIIWSSYALWAASFGDILFLRRPPRPLFLNRGFFVRRRTNAEAEIRGRGTTVQSSFFGPSPPFPKREESRAQKKRQELKRSLHENGRIPERVFLPTGE